MSVFAIGAGACAIGAVLAFVFAGDLYDVALGIALGVLAVPLGLLGLWRSRRASGKAASIVGGIGGLLVAATLAALLVAIFWALAETD